MWELIEKSIAAAQKAELLLGEPGARRKMQEDPEGALEALARMS